MMGLVFKIDMTVREDEPCGLNVETNTIKYENSFKYLLLISLVKWQNQRRF